MPIYRADEKAVIREMARRFEAGQPDISLTAAELQVLGIAPGNLHRICETLEATNMIERDREKLSRPMLIRIRAECAQAVREWDAESKRKRSEYAGKILWSIIGGAIATATTIIVTKLLK